MMSDGVNHNQDLLAYLPRTITQWYHDAPPNSQHTLSRLEGVLTCLDASGFTALTKRLHRHGRQGPELLTNLLNQFFETLCSVAFRFEGDVLKFAGDALWIFFPRAFDPSEFLTLALNSWEEVARLDPIASQHPISIHGGAEAGEFWLASLGDPETIMEVEPMGGLVAEVFRLCDLASENQMALGSRLVHKLYRDQPDSGAKDHLIIQRTDSNKISSVVKVRPEYASQDTGWVRPYVSKEISERIHVGSMNALPQSEHRNVCVMFVYVEYQDITGNGGLREQLLNFNRCICRIIETIVETGGTVGQIDPYMAGHKILAMFGAPRKREDDELRAIACAMAIAKLDLGQCRLRIGLARGPLYCGDVGAAIRREYTVIGDGTNRSARLTAKASWGEVLIDDELVAKLPNELRTEKVVHTLKGIGESIDCYRLLGISDPIRKASDIQKLIGRRTELNYLTKAWSETQHGKARLVNVYGEAGSGKTTLINQFLVDSDVSQGSILVSGKQSILHGHGWCARKVLQELHNANPITGAESFAKHVQREVEPRWWPLLTDILDKDLPENEWTRGLSPDLRTEKSGELYAQLVNSLVDEAQLLILEDFDQLDARSTLLIGGILSSKLVSPLMVVVVSRDKNVNSAEQAETFIEIPTSLPADTEWWAFFRGQFDDGKREREFFARLLEVSGGNPHCVVDYVDRCRIDNSLGVNPVTGKLELVKTGFRVVVPEGLKDYHLSVFDKLSELERDVLKVASAVGMSFKADHITQVVSHTTGATVIRCLDSSVRSTILEWNDEAGSYSFRHSSMRDAIYACVPQQVLKQTHQMIGDVLEAVYSDSRPDILAEHFFQAGLLTKAFPYSLMAASLAQGRSSLADLAVALNRCAVIVETDDTSRLKWTAVRDFYTINAEFLVLEGDYQAAFANLRAWRKAARLNGDRESSLLVCTRLAKRLFVQSKYKRARRVLKTVLASPDLPPNFQASSLAILAEVERRTGSAEAAVDFAREAIDLAREIKDSQSLSEATNNLGLALWGQGKLAEAALAYEECLTLKTVIESRYSRAKIINNLAIIYWELGDFKKARTVMRESLDVFQNVGDRRNVAYCSGNLASLSRIAGRIWEARRHFEVADLIFDRLGDKHAHYYTVGNLGDIDMVLGEFESAEKRFKKTAAFARSVGDQELVAECLTRAGELAFFKGNWVEAEEKLTAGMELSSKIGSSEYLIRAAIGMARLCIGLKEHERVQSLVGLIKDEVSKSNAVAAGHEADFISAELHRIRNETSQAVDRLRQIQEYAKDQEFFELNLFSLVRLYELDVDHRTELKRQLQDMLRWFETTNGDGTWKKLVASPFFRYFVSTLQTVSIPNPMGTTP